MVLDVKDMREPHRTRVDELNEGQPFLYGGSLYYKVVASSTDDCDARLFNAICLASGVLEWFDDEIQVEPCDITVQIVS